MLCKLLALCKYGLVRGVMTQWQGYLLFRRGDGQDVMGGALGKSQVFMPPYGYSSNSKSFLPVDAVIR